MYVSELSQYLSQTYTSSTLSQCSIDQTNYLVQNSAIPVINFDEIKLTESKHQCFPKNVSLTSPDAIFINDNYEIKLIEFKNQLLENVSKPEIRVKLYESLILLKNRFDFNEVEKITYILVHKGKKHLPRFHRIKEGKCPDDLSILKHEYNIAVEVYNAKYFDSNCYKILGTT